MPKIFWTKEELDKSVAFLREYTDIRDVLDRMAAETGYYRSEHSLFSAMRRSGLGRPSDYLKREVMVPARVSPPVKPRADGQELLVKLLELSKQTTSFESLCDKLDVSPARLRSLIDQAKSEGFALQVGIGHLKLGYDASYWGDEQELPIEPTVGGWFKLGVLSDLHAGSKYALHRQTYDCVQRMYRAGVRDIVIAGDLLDGCYKHGVFELRRSGIEEQTEELEKHFLPRMTGLQYHCITGNHDFTFAEHTGLNVGQYIEGAFRDAGRGDIHFYGDRAATLSVGNTKLRLLHPTGSCSYAISYKLQKFVEAFDSGEKPGILLVGHYHRSCYIYTRGVHAIACPTFQGPGSAFGKSLGLGSQAIGGLMLKWKVTKHHTIRELSFRPMNYFKAEQPKEIVR